MIFQCETRPNVIVNTVCIIHTPRITSVIDKRKIIKKKKTISSSTGGVGYEIERLKKSQINKSTPHARSLDRFVFQQLMMITVSQWVRYNDTLESGVAAKTDCRHNNVVCK